MPQARIPGSEWIALDKAVARYKSIARASDGQTKLDFRRHIASGLLKFRHRDKFVAERPVSQREVADSDLRFVTSGEVCVSEGKYDKLFLRVADVDRLCRHRSHTAFLPFVLREDFYGQMPTADCPWLAFNRATDFLELAKSCSEKEAGEILLSQMMRSTLRFGRADGTFWKSLELTRTLQDGASISRQSTGGIMEMGGGYNFYPVLVHAEDFKRIWSLAGPESDVATDEEVRAACLKVYEYARFNDLAPPNMVDAPPLVVKRLSPLTSKALTIKRILNEPQFKKLRRSPGNQRRN